MCMLLDMYIYRHIVLYLPIVESCICDKVTFLLERDLDFPDVIGVWCVVVDIVTVATSEYTVP